MMASPLHPSNGSMSAKNPSFDFCYSIRKPPFNSSNNNIDLARFSTVFCLLGLSSNLFAFVVLVKAFRHTKSSSRSSFLLFLCGLVVTDFMGLLVTGTIVVSYHSTHFNWMELDPNCHFCNFMGMSMVFYGLCPLLLAVTMAVERFVGINLPFTRHSAKVSQSQARHMVAGVWITAGLISLLPLFGLGSYHIQKPGSWCFLNISHVPRHKAFCLIFSLVGLLSLTVSFFLNTVSVVTLLRVCCGQDSRQRRRDYEVEMMVQLILIMVIASICWSPLLVFIAHTVLSPVPRNCPDPNCLDPNYPDPNYPDSDTLLLWIRFATWNQILDPWVYILFRRSVLKCICPCVDCSEFFATIYPPTSFRKLTRASLGDTSRTENTELNGQNSLELKQEALL